MTNHLSLAPLASPLFSNRENDEDCESLRDASHAPVSFTTTIWNHNSEDVHCGQGNTLRLDGNSWRLTFHTPLYYVEQGTRYVTDRQSRVSRITYQLSRTQAAKPLFINRENHEHRETLHDVNHTPLPWITTLSGSDSIAPRV